MGNNLVLKRWLALGATCLVFGSLVVAGVCRNRTRAVAEEDKKAEAAKDWPLFGGTPQRNFVNTTTKGLPEEWDVAKGTNVKWTANLGSKAYGGPIVAGGRIYIGTNNQVPRDANIKGDKGILMCFDEKDGKFLWQLVFDKLAAGRVQDWPEEGICSSPYVEGERIYFVNNRCEVACAAANGDPNKPGQGKVLWTYDMIAQHKVFPHNLTVCSPLVVGDLMFIITANGVDEGHINIPSPEAPSFLCLDKKEGKFVWENNLPSASLVEAKKAGGAVDIRKLVDSGRLLMHGQWSNPVYAEPKGKGQIIFPGGDGWLYAFEPKSGELLWKFDCNPKDSFYVLGPRATRNDFIGTPVVYEDRLYVAVGQDPEHRSGVGHLWCIDITKTPKNKDKDLSPATKKGEKKDDPPQTIFDPKDPANKESALIWHYGGAVPKGQKANRSYLFARSMSTCAIHDGLCYAADMNGYLFCFDAKTGEKYWEHDTGQDTWSSPYWCDGKIYFGNDDRLLFVFKHGRKKEKPEEFEMGGLVRATPIAANGTLYVITESGRTNPAKLYAIGKK